MINVKKELVELFYDKTSFAEDIEDALDHGILVSNLAYMLAKELGEDEEFCLAIADAGLVHDIGKLQLGDYLHGRRKNALKIEEMKYVRMHPTVGYKFLSDRNVGTEELRKAVYHHHENYDGSGYPDNIKEDTIPLESRILRVCDVFSALISERPYRSAFDKNTAIGLMIDEVKNFDMKIFLEFMKVVNSDEFDELDDYVSNVNKKEHVKDKTIYLS